MATIICYHWHTYKNKRLLQSMSATPKSIGVNDEGKCKGDNGDVGGEDICMVFSFSFLD